MGNWPLTPGVGKVTDYGSVTASTMGTQLTAGAANTKGSYTQLVAATDFEAGALLVMLGVSSAAANYLVDIAIGGAGSEQVLVPDLLYFSGVGGNIGMHYPLPLHVPAGARIAARCQSTSAAATMRASVALTPFSPQMNPPCHRVTAYGANAADSGGTLLSGSGSANGLGAYSQLSSAITNPTRYLMAVLGNAGDDARSTIHFLLDIATGAAASEVTRLSNLYFNTESATDRPHPDVMGPFPMTIAAGTRLAARIRNSATTAGDRDIDCVAYGLD